LDKKKKKQDPNYKIARGKRSGCGSTVTVPAYEVQSPNSKPTIAKTEYFIMSQCYDKYFKLKINLTEIKYL
jgi:hypothetical protein